MVCALVGMSGLAVAIIGGPLTMGFLALESTGSLPLTIAVLAACVVSALTVRRTFGYSFATWRFHLRGEAIRSAVDIGWMRNLTVGRMMRREVRTVRADTPLAAFRRDFPLGATQRVVVLDDEDRYAGIVLLAEAHADAEDDHTVGRPAAPHRHDAAAADDDQGSGGDVRERRERRAGGGRRAGDPARDRPADRAIRAAALQRGTGPAAAGAVRGVTGDGSGG